MPTFPRTARLRNPKQFQSTFVQGRRINGPLFRLHLHLSPLARDELGSAHALPAKSVPVKTRSDSDFAGARLGVAVSKRVDAHAVGRNRIKRVARESFRLIRALLPAGDYVLLAQRQSASADSAQLLQALNTLWTHATALGAAVHGSIPAPDAKSGEVPLKRSAAAVTMPPRDLAVPAPGCTPELP